MHLPSFATSFLLRAMRKRCENRRPPDVHIGGKNSGRLHSSSYGRGPRTGTPIYRDTYLERWWVIPRNKVFNIYFHRIMRSDDDRALHDHPWWNVSILLAGRYLEAVPVESDDPQGEVKFLQRRAGDVVFRRAEASHRLVLIDGVDGQPMNTWTLFITGPYRRVWGFWCPAGWRDFRTFTGVKSGGKSYDGSGPGCGEV